MPSDKAVNADNPSNETKAMDSAYKALVSLKPDEQRRVLAWLPQKLNLSPTEQPPIGEGTSMQVSTTSVSHTLKLKGEPGSREHAKAFMNQKKPVDFQERVACLAYYLTHYMNTPTFKTRDITGVNGLAGQPNLSNPAVFVSNSVRAQYLSSAGKGRQQITARGEALVEALPDREKVKEAIEDHKLSGRRKKGKGKSPKLRQGTKRASTDTGRASQTYTYAACR